MRFNVNQRLLRYYNVFIQSEIIDKIKVENKKVWLGS